MGPQARRGQASVAARRPKTPLTQPPPPPAQPLPTRCGNAAAPPIPAPMAAAAAAAAAAAVAAAALTSEAGWPGASRPIPMHTTAWQLPCLRFERKRVAGKQEGGNGNPFV
eukprot:scaffold43140_cov62-Phaeocystis_antarctica.AAC.4